MTRHSQPNLPARAARLGIESVEACGTLSSVMTLSNLFIRVSLKHTSISHTRDEIPVVPTA